METKTLIAAIVGATLLQYGSLQTNAQTSDNQTQEPGDEAIMAGEKLTPPPLIADNSAKSVVDLLNHDLDTQELKVRGWDKKKSRYVDISSFEYPIEGPVTASKVVTALNVANLGIYMSAFQQFCQYLGEKNDFEANLTVPSSPVGREYKDAQQKFNVELASLEKELANNRLKLQEAISIMDSANAGKAEELKRLDERVAAQEKVVKKLNNQAQYGPNTLDRINIAMDALVKKVDANYNPSAVSSIKKEKAANAQENLDAIKNDQESIKLQKIDEAKKDSEVLDARIAELGQKIKEKTAEAQEYYQNYRETWVGSKHNWSSDYSIVGLTPIKYYYSLKKNNKGGGVLQVAAAFAWSPALERATRAVLHTVGNESIEESKYLERFPKSESLIKPGKISLEDWIIGQSDHMDAFGPARWYVDDDGTRYFLGVAYSVVGRGGAYNANQQIIRRDAIRNLELCLNVKVQNQGTKDESTIVGMDASQNQSVFNSVTKASHTGLDIVSVARDGTFTLNLNEGNQQSEPIHWLAMKVSENDIRSAFSAAQVQADNAAMANDAKYRRIGSRKALSDHVKESEKNTSPMNEAYSKTKNELKKSATSSAPQQGGNVIIMRPATNTPIQGTVQPFIKGDKSKVPDDF